MAKRYEVFTKTLTLGGRQFTYGLYVSGVEALEAIGGAVADSMYLWLRDGRGGGSFFTPLLLNNLRLTIVSADSINKPKIEACVRWLYQYAPGDSLGSEARLDAWGEAHDEHRAGLAPREVQS